MGVHVRAVATHEAHQGLAKALAASIARLDGADTAHTIGIPAIAAFCTISKLTRPETMSTSFASGSCRSSSACPTSLSSAL